jgi:hypothetical protein
MSRFMLRRGLFMAVRRMRSTSKPLSVLLLAVSMAVAVPVFGAQNHGRASKPSRPAHQHLTLEQAVQRVQDRTHGKVLKADSRNTGRAVEYRIKVLTPDGHVRVITMRSDQTNADTK